MAGPYSVECYTHKAAIGVPCDAHGTCCANRIARALFVNADETRAISVTLAGFPNAAAMNGMNILTFLENFD